MVRDIYICTIVHGTWYMLRLLLSICSMCCNYSHGHVICVLYISNIFRRKLSSAVNQRTNRRTNQPTNRPSDRQEQFLRLKTALVPMLLVSPHSRINQSAIWCIVGITAWNKNMLLYLCTSKHASENGQQVSYDYIGPSFHSFERTENIFENFQPNKVDLYKCTKYIMIVINMTVICRRRKTP